MKQIAITLSCMLGAGTFLAVVCDAPSWASVIGSWVFWAAVRPKEWA